MMQHGRHCLQLLLHVSSSPELRRLTLPEVGTALTRLAPRKVLAIIVDAICSTVKL